MMNPIQERLKATRFLVVDDSHFQRALTCETLRAAGANMIEPAASAADAQEAAKLFAPDVVLTDWVMDPVDGLELTKMIRRHATLIRRDVPIIMITSKKTAADVQAAQNAGVDEYLVKPFNTDGILRRLDAVFNKRGESWSPIMMAPCGACSMTKPRSMRMAQRRKS
jgi:DNA-binding response OmpR family regulator